MVHIMNQFKHPMNKYLIKNDKTLRDILKLQ
jgi:hypothetical protein